MTLVMFVEKRGGAALLTEEKNDNNLSFFPSSTE